MQFFILCVVVVALCTLPALSANTQNNDVTATPPAVAANSTAMPDILTTLKPTHPRLIASSASWDEIKARRQQDPSLAAFLKRSEIEARALLKVPPVPYKKAGRRLLHVSRVVVRRVLLLSLHFHLTGDPAFSRRAQEEMLSVAAFIDWNPSHFLDTAEMTTALALGYDWLYDELDVPTRLTIETAIIEKGLKAGIANNSWMRAENNWNSVCHAGMALGALAVAERDPVLAAQSLQNAKELNPLGLKPYAPQGVYPEGAMYWGYGTIYQVVLLEALRTALGTDWGLSQSPGFLESADALLQSIGPSGAFFNFFDGIERPSLEGANYWFAHELKRPELLRFETHRMQSYADLTRPTNPDSEADRLMPLTALWWPSAINPNAPPLAKNWYGTGPNPLASFRTSWDDPNAMFLALKGGKAMLSHGHMDSGSFVFESDGIRWARDLGMQDYLSLESKGVDMWSSKQEGQRWSVFRLNNFSHNTLTINGQLHRANGQGEITHFSAGKDAGAILDLSPVFAGQASRVTRGFSFRPGSHTLIRDELEGLKAGDTVRWAMVMGAEIEVSPDGSTAVLSQGGKSLWVGLNSPTGAKFEVISGEPPANNYDAANPEMQILTINFSAPESGKLSWSVILQPATNGKTATPDLLAQTELKDWPQAATK